MERHTVTKDTSDFRLDRNECICPSIQRKLLLSTPYNVNHLHNYSSTYGLQELLQDAIGIDKDSIHVNNGSEVIIKTLLEGLLCEWVTTHPTFELFSFYCIHYGRKLKYIDYRYTHGKFHISIPLDGKNKGLYIVSPHNPTMYTFSNEQIIEFCNHYKYVILDEAYLKTDTPKNLDIFPNNLIVLRTFSKTGGLTGARVGFCFTNNADVTKLLCCKRPMFINSYSIELAKTVLRAGYTIIIENEFKKTLELLKPQFNILASGSNFILIDHIKSYSGYNLREYMFSNHHFSRLTLFDTETYNIINA